MKYLLLLLLVSFGVLANDPIRSEPEIIRLAKQCAMYGELTDAEMVKVMTLSLKGMALRSDDKCAELSDKLKPMKAWYE